MMDYKETLNLPETEFPMRGNLPVREPEVIARWKQIDLDAKLELAGQGRPNFTLHDGPPYANGNIHIGHALNKILKDIIIKSKRMHGFYTPYVPGWDCHGLPIELKVDQKLGKRKREMTKGEIRKECRIYAKNWVDIQSEEFQRLGIFGDWENPYLTMTPDYEAATARELARFAERKGLYKGKKPVHWCPSCVTALAEAEVEHEDHTSPSIFVKFPFVDELPSELSPLAGKKISFVIWTTTPWTIPANLAVCLNPKLPYVAVEVGDDVLVMAEGLYESVLKSLEITDYTILATFSAAPFEKKRCKHPLYDRDSLLVLGDYVTLETGTGCVHTAPGHGQDDYVTGLRYGLEIYNPVNDYGKYYDEVEFFAGLNVTKTANDAVNSKLEEVGALLQVGKISHSYPHCWRCKKPIIFRATEQWFISMEANDLRKKALDHINDVEWIPHWGRDRIFNMIENRPDWCISRQRTWGVPITALYCKKCGEIFADGKMMHHVADLFEESGSDIWFEREAKELIPEGTVCPACGHDDFDKEMDILDVWFDSGVSHAAVVEKRVELNSPADLYLEGSDQHRGWFHSSLLACVGTRDTAPYKAVLTHGFVLDEKGRPMSKSTGNVVAPEKVINKFGAELLRLWVATQDYRNDTRVGDHILQQVAEAYRRIRNTARYMLGSLNDFTPATDSIHPTQMLEIDRWAVSRLVGLTEKVETSYNAYEFHTVHYAVHNFCSIDMSAFYLDILKDRLYTSAPDSLARRSGQTALYQIIDTLTRLIAPILSFTADEIWWQLPGEREESVHLAGFPKLDAGLKDAALEERYKQLISIRSDVTKAIEQARSAKTVGHSLDAKVEIAVPADEYGALLDCYRSELASLFIVSQAELVDSMEGGFEGEEIPGLRITVSKADGVKCERCWNYATSVGSNSDHPAICDRCISNLVQG
jgi:isoleucyl-tRNA synthetase